MRASNLKLAIEQSSCIVIASHLNPDYDAVCSSLLLSETIQANYHNKQVTVVLEDKPYGIEMLVGSEKIKVLSIHAALEKYQPDCLILLDVNTFDGITRHGDAALREYIKQHKLLTVVVDHHEYEGKDVFDVRLQNTDVPAVTQLIYDLCFHRLKMSKPAGYGLTTMLGIVSDSGTFTYAYNDYSETFTIVNELMRAGVTIQEAVNIIEALDITQIKIIGELAGNIRVEHDYAYSFISDETAAAWKHNNDEVGKLKAACTAFGNRYISNVDGKTWGVIIHPDTSGQKGKYRASFRAQASASRDIFKIAAYLGAKAGHKRAAGATFGAATIDEAIRKVRNAIAVVV